MRKPFRFGRKIVNRIEVLEARRLLAATPQLLADINTQESGSPRDFIEFDGRLFYTVNHPQYGRELWSSDGTPAGTQLVKDIYPGLISSSIANLFVFDEHLYFTANDSTHGTELWRTDGTPEGTELFFEGRAGSSGGVRSMQFAEVAGMLYFVSQEGSSSGSLRKTDGTSTGTTVVLSLPNSGEINDLTAVGDKLFFTRTTNFTDEELWVSDGTAAGTMLVKDINPGSSSSWPSGLTAFDGEVYFEAYTTGQSYRLWKSDGTAAGTVPVQGTQAFSLSSEESLTVVGDKLYFSGRVGSPYGVWVIDGQGALARPVMSFGSISAPDEFTAVEATLFFRAYANGVYSLWKSDGTSEGTQLLKPLQEDGSSFLIRETASYQGELFFSTYASDAPADLWRSNGTPEGTVRAIASIAPAASGLSVQLEAAGGFLFYAGNNQGTGVELWRIDGESSRQLLQDISGLGTDSSNPTKFVSTATHVFFEANNGVSAQLFAIAPGAQPVQITADSLKNADVEQLTPVGNLLYFVATDANGETYLGVSDGTAAGTRRLDFPFVPRNAEIYGIAAFADGIVFVVDDGDQDVLLCRADADGIEVVHSLGRYSRVPFDKFDSVVWQGNYYFVASTDNDDIWRTDGTASGTQRLRDTLPEIGIFGHSLTATDEALYFVSQQVSQTQAALWRTDGTVGGTYSYWFMSAPTRLIGAGKYLFHVMPGSSGGSMLWATDGTIPGTRVLATYVEPGRQMSSSPTASPVAASLDGNLYFFSPIPNGFGQLALWKSDGTPAGTTRVKDIPLSPNAPWFVMERDGQLFVITNYFLYRSDGTTDGTREVTQNFPYDPYTNNIPAFAWLGDSLYFGSSLPGYGVEPTFLRHPFSTVVGRHLFYNGSKFDGGTTSLNADDDQAIATEKTAYLPGSGPATFANIFSYSRGITGLMVDLLDVPAGPNPLTAGDFRFRMGTSADPKDWIEAPGPDGFLVRDVQINGQPHKRVSFSWFSRNIANTWLEVTVLANERTGLSKPDTFYFGSRVGDTGSGTPSAAMTNIADELAARNAPNANAPITSLLDFNRDGLVNIADALVARNNAGILPKLNLPAAGTAAPLAAVPLAATSLLTEVERPMHSGHLTAETPSHQPLGSAVRDLRWAYAVQRWNDWLDADELDEELIAGLASVSRARR